VFPNASAKLKGERGTFLGEAMLGMRDVSAVSLRRPVDRGYVVGWELQREILARWVAARVFVGQGTGSFGPWSVAAGRWMHALVWFSTACHGAGPAWPHTHG
jgi:hypothetical protein